MLPPELMYALCTDAPSVLAVLQSMRAHNPYALLVLSVKPEAYGSVLIASAPPGQHLGPLLYEIEDHIPRTVLNKVVAGASQMGLL